MDNRDLHAIVTLDIPSSALCGVDLVSFTTTPQFQGIKHVPAGWHFIYTSLTPSLSVRHGTWVNISLQATSRQTRLSDGTNGAVVIVKKWDSQNEELVDEKDEVALARLKSNAVATWRERLTHYRLLLGGSPGREGSGGVNDAAVEEKLRDWHALTDCITPELLSRVTGGDWNNWRLSSASSAAQDVDEIPGLPSDLAAGDSDGTGQAGEGRELHFLPIDLKRTWRSGAIGRERTEAAQDRSWALGDIISNHCVVGGTAAQLEQEKHARPKEDVQAQPSDSSSHDEEQKEKYLIGEMQFTFLMILTLANYSCMEQWKRILSIVLTSRVAIVERPGLFIRILELLEVQLRHCNDVEGGLFDLGSGDDEGGGSPLLKKLLKTFRRNLEDVSSEQHSEELHFEGGDGGGVLQADKNDAPSSSNPGAAPAPDPDPDPRTKPQPTKSLRNVQRAFHKLETYLTQDFNWHLSDAYVRRGMVQLEDGEQVEMELDDLQDQDERGEYAPVVVDLS